MSTAIMPQNALYDFGDNLIMGGDSSPGGHISVHSAAMRLTLSRVASSPGAATTTPANLAVLLGNLSFQQHHHHHHHHHHHSNNNNNNNNNSTSHRRLERTQSAPAPSLSTIAAPTTPTALSTNTSRYKTELCRPYEEFGVCKYGDKCQFAHGGGELRSLARHPKYKTELCRTYHTVGFCPYGPRCHFVHNQEEVLLLKPALLGGGAPNINGSRTSVISPIPSTGPLSLDSLSPSCSLSQSPTSSLGSFFSSDPELHSPVDGGGGSGTFLNHIVSLNNSSNSTSSPTTILTEDQRLPVFNRLSDAQILSLTELIL